MLKTQLNGSCSRIYPKQHNITDMTNESAFPNITNEELHVTMSRYNAPLDDITQNLSNSNNTTFFANQNQS